jgi:hypothetical protein
LTAMISSPILTIPHFSADDPLAILLTCKPVCISFIRSSILVRSHEVTRMRVHAHTSTHYNTRYTHRHGHGHRQRQRQRLRHKTQLQRQNKASSTLKLCAGTSKNEHLHLYSAGVGNKFRRRPSRALPAWTTSLILTE